MPKFLVFYGSLLFAFIYFSSADMPYKCVHERVAPPLVPSGVLSYKEARPKRESHDSKFQPLSIHTHLDEIDPSITENVVFSINIALKMAEQYLGKILTVVRTFNPFYLERTSCSKVWQSGPNRGKCAQLSSAHKVENCHVTGTQYVIPNRYLYSLKTYDYDDESPNKELRKGEGVPNANFILFVIMRTTSLCKESDIQAYGSYCRLDSHNRPVAGLINLCPEYFSKRLYRQSHYYNVVLHELIHILGFSSNLYRKFKPCTEHGCQSPRKFMYIDSYGIQRLVFPKIVQNMQAHFNCSEENFGGPLESNASEIYKVSHWHPLLMYTSIMTPSILEDDYVVLDNITLALLSSTGWYDVNFTLVGNFIFGKDGGCNFGFTESCETSKHLCTVSDNSSVSKGCDILQFTIGNCERIIPSHPCGTYRADREMTCQDEQNKYFGVNVRSFYHEKRCITLQNLTDMTTEPSCMVVRCKKLTGVDVYVNSSWISCPLSKKVQMNENLSIECPRDPYVCPFEFEKESEKQFCTRQENFALSVRIYFTSPEVKYISQNSNVKNFKAYTLDEITRVLNIPVNYIVNATIFLFKVMYLEFDICPPKNISNEELSQLISKLQAFLKSPSFQYVFPGIINLPVATKKHMLDPTVAVTFSDYEGFRMLTIVPVICAIFVIATFIASLSRYVIIQRHRPKRQTVEMENLEQSNGKTQLSNEPLVSNINLLRNL